MLDGETVDNCFELEKVQDAVEGVDGLLESYESTLGKVELSGPTVMAECVDNFLNRIISQRVRNYHIILVLSDGDLIGEDLRNMKRVLVEMSGQPVSVILIGLGDGHEDFENIK